MRAFIRGHDGLTARLPCEIITAIGTYGAYGAYGAHGAYGA